MAQTIPFEYAGLKESGKCSFSQLMGKSKDHFKEGKSSGLIPGYRRVVENMGESEGIGSSGRIGAEMTASEGSCAPTRKCISLNACSYDNFGVPRQALQLSKMSQSERKDLVLRLKLELEQVRLLQKKVASFGSSVDFLSPSVDKRSCSDGNKRPPLENFNRSGVLSPQGKKRPVEGHNGTNRKKTTSGRFEQKPAVAVSISNAYLMKQCKALLNHLMQHNFGWVFNNPVDVVKLNIPDYFTVIKHPMDFGTVRKKMASGKYASQLDFATDVRLTLSNAMTYNPPGNDVHTMAETLSKYFEARWKAIEKKLPITMNVDAKPSISAERIEVETNCNILPLEKKKINLKESIIKPEAIGQIMTNQEKQSLSTELESLLGELPENIINFLKEHSYTDGQMGEDEIEIDIDALSDETLFKLRKLLDEYLLGKQKNQAKAEPCEMELRNESGFNNSPMQPCKDSDSGSESDAGKASVPVSSTKENSNLGTNVNLQNSSAAAPNDANQSLNEFGQVELNSHDKPGAIEVEDQQEEESAPSERQVSPEKLYHVALVRKRFVDTILKAREKALEKGVKGDPVKLQMEREELERRQREEKARLQAEAKAAEEAKKKAEAEAAVQAKRKRELEREAARQALLKVEKTVDINENGRFMEDLEMLRATNDESLPDFMEETSPSHSQKELGSFNLRGISNPLEQLGLYMKADEEEEEEEKPPQSAPVPVNDIEEGEID
ncbi:nucleoside diphosphate kinase 2 [Hibiscus syriacus]|uniref:Nucleoside diphosphate kinase 2 n=1 Tax=Hibiscus syriacus TaxID=106335 RepID=A0A6A2Y4H8_HIBSY|nr:transcription factor GTE8-like [Hibiscus syriacus]KAE8663484.1 nucleoside diphosphate kinase 2 [Hibiscus syriacus]